MDDDSGINHSPINMVEYFSRTPFFDSISWTSLCGKNLGNYCPIPAGFPAACFHRARSRNFNLPVLLITGRWYLHTERWTREKCSKCCDFQTKYSKRCDFQSISLLRAKSLWQISVNGAFFKDVKNVDRKSLFLSSEISLVVIQKITPMIQPLGIVAAILRFYSKCFFKGLST